MTYTVNTGHADGRAFHWWAYFLAYGIPFINDRFDIQYWLDHHNSRATSNLNGDCIEFESEQDFTAFVLRWS